MALFRKWIINHIDSWFAYTQELELGISMEDIILVTGCHRTTSWTNIAFNEVQAGAQLSLQVNVTDALGGNINWGISNVHVQGAVHNQGPSGKVRGSQIPRTSGFSTYFLRIYLRTNAYLSKDIVRNVIYSG